jgi:hypothetical protein
MSVVRVILGIGTTLLLSGCLAASGAVGALLAGGGGDGGSGSVPAPTQPRLDAPVIPLPGTPVAMVVGNFFEGSPLDAAVLIGDKGILSIFEGDGLGGFPKRIDFELDASFPKDVERVSRPQSLDTLLVADRIGLQVIEWDKTASLFRVVQRVEFDGTSESSLSQQQIAIGNFDGKDPPDAAVSLQNSDRCELFFGGESGGAFSLERGPIAQVNSPRALAAANFDDDESGLSDLVLIEETGDPVLTLLLNEGNETFAMQSQLRVPDLETGPGATLHAREGAMFRDPSGKRIIDDDPFPDFIACKLHGVFRVFVRKDSNGRPVLAEHSGPTGPPTITPKGAVLIQLPRNLNITGENEIVTSISKSRSWYSRRSMLWDIVALDADMLSFEYGGDDNLNGPGVIRRTLPGEAAALRSGYIDADRLEDILVATSGPTPGLVVMLANPENDTVEDEPLRYRQAVRAGENVPEWLNLDTVTSGRYRASDGTLLPFLAAVRQRSGIVIVLLNELGVPEEVNEVLVLQSSDGRILRLEWVRAGDLDQDGDDDLIVVSDDTALRLLRNDGGHAFRWIGLEEDGLLVDVARHAEEIEGLRGNLVLRNPTLARIDSGESLDIVMPASNIANSHEDFLAVILNPGDGSATMKVSFLRTLNNPRQVSVTEIDGDGLPDLLVSNKDSHQIDVLLSSPSSAEGFVRGEIVDLEKENIPGKVELTVTDLPDPGVTTGDARKQARVIVLAAEETVAVMLNRTEQPGVPLLDVPEQNSIHQFSDAEFVILADIFPDTVGLDLIVADEDKGAVKLFRREKDPFVDVLGSFRFATELLFEGRPDELALFEIKSGLGLAATTKRNALELYLSCPSQDACTFERQPRIDFSIQPKLGGRAGLSVAGGQGTSFIASLVEDGERITGESAIDRVRIAGIPLEALSLRDIGLPSQEDCQAKSCVDRVLLGPQIIADGVLVGRFDVGSDPDILFHDAESGVFCIVPDSDVARAAACGRLDEAIQDLLCVGDGSGSRHKAFVVTKRSTRIFDPIVDAWEGVSEFDEDIFGAAPILDGSGSVSSVALLLKERLVAVGAGDPESICTFGPEEDAIVGCARLGRDDPHDDVVLVTSTKIRTFRGTGFKPLQELPLSGARKPRDIAFLDANSDTYVDLCIATTKGTIILLPGNSKGRFVGDAMREIFVWPDIEAVSALPLDDWGDEIIVSARSPGLFIVRTLDPKKTVR